MDGSLLAPYVPPKANAEPFLLNNTTLPFTQYLKVFK